MTDHQKPEQRGPESGSPVTIRPARAADLDGLVASSSALFAEDAGTRDPGVDITWPREHGREVFAAGLDDPARLLLVADRDGEVVGHLTGRVADGTDVRPARVAELMSLYVRAAHRRERLGSRLVEAFRGWARAEGATLAEVSAYAANGDAIRFYEREGFAPKTVTLGLSL